MIKKCILFFLLFTTGTISAQEASCDQKVKNLLLNKVKSFDSKNLIPYFSEKQNKWGYMDRVSKKIITTPILNDVSFFKPDLEFESSFTNADLGNGCDGKITGSKENYTIKSLENTDYQAYTTDYNGPIPAKKKYESMIKNSINGFEVDAEGNLSNFNSKFYDNINDKPLIWKIFQFKEKYYAIVETVKEKKEYYDIIDQNGNEFEGFKKITSFPSLKQIYSNDTDIWFLLKIKDNQYVYRSLLENKQLKDILDDNHVYGEDQTQSLGYVIYTSNKMKGVFDLTTMSWKIPPSKKNDFSYIYYSCSDPLLYNYDKTKIRYKNDVIVSNKFIEENRTKSYIYILSSENIFYDLNLKSYKPVRK